MATLKKAEELLAGASEKERQLVYQMFQVDEQIQEARLRLRSLLLQRKGLQESRQILQGSIAALRAVLEMEGREDEKGDKGEKPAVA